MAKQEQALNHIAFIMDGNGRWAKKRFLVRSAGHKAGVRKINEIVLSCFFDHDIRYVTLFAFSSENWNRPQEEVDTLFELLAEYFNDNIDNFVEKQIKIQIVGDLTDERIPQKILDAVHNAEERTSSFEDHIFTVLFNYGGRNDIVYSAREIAKKVEAGELKPEDINDEVFRENLISSSLPDIDLLIRTSGEMRISNCPLYQAGYTEFVFNLCLWPDYNKEELAEDIGIYYHRQRRFGSIKE